MVQPPRGGLQQDLRREAGSQLQGLGDLSEHLSVVQTLVINRRRNLLSAFNLTFAFTIVNNLLVKYI